MKVAIIIYENCTSSMVTGFWDILSLADQLHFDKTGKHSFKLELVGVKKTSVQSFSGLFFTPKQTIDSMTSADLVYVPGFLGDPDAVIEKERKLINWISQVDHTKTIVSAACNGNILLAASGILNGKRATTHWSLIPRFKTEFSQIQLEPEKIIIDNTDIISAAGVTAFYNLGLHIIQRFINAEIALACAKIFLVDAGRKLQSPYQIYQISKSHGDKEIVEVQNWLESNFQDEISVDQLAQKVNLGQKTFLRRFKKATGETPLVYLQKLRIETAKRLLESGTYKTFYEITWKVGYNDVSSFHKRFKHETGLTPAEYRSKFVLG